jgi:signal transduction histidine kinase
MPSELPFRRATPLAAVVLAAIGTLAAAEPLTRLAELRALPASEAASKLPIHVEGTVVGIYPENPAQFFLHDGSAVSFVRVPDGTTSPKVAPGDHVRVEGSSDPLGYYPSIRGALVTVLGTRPLPPPLQPGAGQLHAPEMDSEWVEVPAVVIGYEAEESRFTLALEVHGLPFKAELPPSPDAEERAAALMQRPVRLRGVIGTIFNRQRQMTDRHFFVSSFDAIVPTTPRTDGESSPLLEVGSLLTAGYGPLSMVRVQGVVTQRSGEGFHLRDASGSTFVQAAMADRFSPGSRVEAEGFGAVAPYRPILRATRVKALAGGPPPAPIPFAASHQDLPALHAELVTLDADLLGVRDGPVEDVLQFRDGERFFEAFLPDGDAADRPPLRPGDRLRLTGICELTTTHALPRIAWVDGFRIHLPRSGGLEILSRAPWWTARRLLIALVLTGALAILGIAGTWILRRQVRRQMDIIGRKLQAEAVVEERDRMARELHDTLEQQLSGVALQLDGLDHAVKRNPSGAESILLLARRMLRHTRLEARRSVWDLRSKVLHDHGLPAALHAISESVGTHEAPAIDVRVAGQARTLPPGADFHLLRIAQEAVTNAIKHGAAGSILVGLDYLGNRVRLVVRDDGRGFDPAAAPSGPGPHFGLLGMRERAAKIGAAMDLASSPGRGCMITVDLPIPATP